MQRGVSVLNALAPAIFASAFHPHVGGVEELVRQLAAGQRERGLRPVVVTNRFPKALPANGEHRGIPVVRHSFRVPEPTWRQMGGWLLKSRATRRDISRGLAARGTDLIHVQCVSSNARYALAAQRALQVPLVVTMQGELSMDATRVYERSAQLRRTWRRALDEAHMITGCSQYVLDEAEERYGASFGDRARVVYNGIRLAEFDHEAEPSSRRPYVLGIGRMVEQKGFDLLIEAFSSVAAGLDDIELVLAGSGSAEPALRQQAARSPYAERIVFLGSVAHERAVKLFKSARAFVLCSRHEPQGIVVLEAMAARTPVLAAAVGGVPELVSDGENGILFDGGSAPALATALLRIVGDDQLRLRLVDAGRRTAEQHDWTAVTDQYLAVYGEAARRCT